jgi:hypothetical protein
VLTTTEAGAALVAATRRKRDAWLYRRIMALPREEREVLAKATGIIRELADS